MRPIVLASLAVLAWAPLAEVTAQRVARTPFTPVSLPQELFADTNDGPSTVSRIASALGSAVLGAGLGFFASQLVEGDWDETGGSGAVDRGLWAAVGGSVGFTVGLKFPILSRGQGIAGSGGLPRGRQHLAAPALEGIGMSNAYEAVQSLRPEWLVIRGARSLAAGTDPIRVEGSGAGVRITGSTPLISEAGTIQVYVNGVNVGGVASLSAINVLTVQDMYFFDAAAATIRWGEGNPHGAILVIT
jgi:hypothetical protein